MFDLPFIAQIYIYLYLQARLGPTRVEPLSGLLSNSSLLALPVNVRLGWTWMAVANTYHNMAAITVVKALFTSSTLIRFNFQAECVFNEQTINTSWRSQHSSTPMWVETLSSLSSQTQSQGSDVRVPANFLRATQANFAFAPTQVDSKQAGCSFLRVYCDYCMILLS